MNLKGLTPAQLFDSLVAATGHREPGFMRQNQFNFNPQPNNPRSQFLNRFAVEREGDRGQHDDPASPDADERPVHHAT